MVVFGTIGIVDALSRRLVPDELWDVVEPLIPEHGVRPQGGGPQRVGDRAVFTAIVYVLTTGWCLAAPSSFVRGEPPDRSPALR